MKLDFTKYKDGLVPAIVQDATTKNVLMLGFMNNEALNKTQELKKNIKIKKQEFLNEEDIFSSNHNQLISKFFSFS